MKKRLLYIFLAVTILVAGIFTISVYADAGGFSCNSDYGGGYDYDGTVRIICPSCSAPLAINQNAKCPYCGSIINSKDYDWSIAAIKGISQRTAGS